MKRNFQRLAIIAIVLFVATLLLSRFTEWNIERNIPDIIHNALSSAKASKVVKNKIGEIITDESSFNIHDLDGDSISYIITLTGDKAKMSIKTRARKTGDNEWLTSSSDTLIFNY